MVHATGHIMKVNIVRILRLKMLHLYLQITVFIKYKVNSNSNVMNFNLH
jgi:hypothetical protein